MLSTNQKGTNIAKQLAVLNPSQPSNSKQNHGLLFHAANTATTYNQTATHEEAPEFAVDNIQQGKFIILQIPLLLL